MTLGIATPEINICTVQDILSGSQHFVPVIRESCRSKLAMEIAIEFDSNLHKNIPSNFEYNNVYAIALWIPTFI